MRALWSDRQNCSNNASQKVKRIRRVSDQLPCNYRHHGGNFETGKKPSLVGERRFWGCAKGAEKASCGETVVQKGVLESPFLLFPFKVFRCFQGKPYYGREETDSSKNTFLDDRFPARFVFPTSKPPALSKCLLGTLL